MYFSRSRALQATDQWGEFVFAGLPAGHYRLVFTGQDTELVIPELQLGPFRPQPSNNQSAAQHLGRM